MRSASFIALGTCLALFAWRVTAANHDSDVGGWLFVAGPVFFVGLVAAVLCVAIALFLRISRADAPGGALPWFVMAIAVALVAATPIAFGYDDGCNDHGAIAPLGAAPLIAIVKPASGAGSYSDWSTLVGCPGM